MDRRGFLGSILALGLAPAIVRADSLMRIVPRETGIILIEGPHWGTFDELVSETFRRHSKILLDNAIRHNALYQRYIESLE